MLLFESIPSYAKIIINTDRIRVFIMSVCYIVFSRHKAGCILIFNAYNKLPIFDMRGEKK